MVELLITSIKELNSKKVIICLNYDESFALYKGELRRLHLKEGDVLNESAYKEIVSALSKRATKRAMSLLQTRDYLTEELKSKLRQSYYPEESIESAINYINKYGYLDDRRYVYNYFHFKSANKSRKVLELKLIQKGADLALIKEIADEFYEDNDSEIKQIVKLVRKKLKLSEDESLESIDYASKSKLIAYLFRRGYTMDIINKALRIVIINY